MVNGRHAEFTRSEIRACFATISSVLFISCDFEFGKRRCTEEAQVLLKKTRPSFIQFGVSFRIIPLNGIHCTVATDSCSAVGKRG